MKVILPIALLALSAHFLHAQGVLAPPRNLYEKVSLRPADSGAASVMAAILAHKEGQFPPGGGLVLVSSKGSPGGRHHHYAQAHMGVPVHEGSVLATVDGSGRVIHLLSRILPYGTVGAAHPLDSAGLAAWVQDELLGGLEVWHVAQRVWLAEGGALRAAYCVRHDEGITAYEKLFDAHTGELLHVRDLQVFHHRAQTDSTAYGMVFNPDPLTTSGMTYGGTYVDNFDSDHADLNAQRQAVLLRDVTWNGMSFVLSGPHVRLVDVEAPTVAVAQSSTGNFDFTRSQSGFEDVMCYYHIDTFQRYVQSLGFTNLLNTGVDCDPHGVNGADNSHFVASGGGGRVAFGEGGVDDAEDADVIIHEYGHALSNAALNGGNSGNERQGLDEGLGDYFATSYSKALRYNLWKNVFTWDGHNEFWDGRSASVSTLYPPSSTNIYTYGEIWNTALMEVHDIIGRMRSDRVVLQSLYSNAAFMTLNDAAHVILDADSLLYGGVHTDEYQAAFCRRGIFTGTNVGEECYVGRADGVDPAIAVRLWPNPGAGPWTLRLARPVGQGKVRVLDAVGRELLVQPLRGLEAELDAGALPAGMYVVEVSAAGWRRGVVRLVVPGP